MGIEGNSQYTYNQEKSSILIEEDRKLFIMAQNSVKHFLDWKMLNGYMSYDQYDLWSTRYGIWGKSIFYRNKFLGAALVAPIFFCEVFYPSIRKVFVKEKRFPIADAHFIMGYINLYKVSKNKIYLVEAQNIAKTLMESSITGFTGHCWGYPFDWMTTRGLWTRGIPLMTTTVYCFEAFLALYDSTQDQQYFDVAHSIFLFALEDIKDVVLDKDISVCSYSPVDKSQIVNANAYRAFVLVEGAIRFFDSRALTIAKRNLNFILATQETDGSWPYAANELHDNFVDNFHTCFVLKNLIKVNAHLKDERIDIAIFKGFDFYKKNLLTPDIIPKPFAKLSRLNLVKIEMYDYAEGISLCLQMEKKDNEAKKIATKFINDVVTYYQNDNGSFFTRINRLGLPNKIPYLRWSQSQLFYAISNFLLKSYN